MEFDDFTVLIVDDEKHTREGIRLSLEDQFDVYIAANIQESLDIIENQKIDVLLTDLKLGSENGLDLIEKVLKLSKSTVCILTTAYGSEEVAVEAMKKGAYDYIRKPINIDELDIVIKRAIRTHQVEKENIVLKTQISEKFGVQNIIGNSEAMQPIFDTISQVASSKATILIQGESGTGKELAAKAIHYLSTRPKSKLVTVHCAALSENLLESELFGHEKGSFTGALGKRIGRFEEADGGTLFLDEIGEIDLNIQVKLLRAIGERTINRIGSNKSIKVDVRLIVATNKDLKKMVQEGKFREDLFFRLNVISILMPSLRDRKEDIVLLSESFLKELAKDNNKEGIKLNHKALKVLISYDWPGNVRELRTAIEHGIVMSNSDEVRIEHLPHFLLDKSNYDLLNEDNDLESINLSHKKLDDLNLDNLEKTAITEALKRTNNNKTEASKLLGISRRTMQRKLIKINNN